MGLLTNLVFSEYYDGQYRTDIEWTVVPITTYNDDTLTCAATVTDPDESPVPTFEWTVGGNVIGSSATSTIVGCDMTW